MKIRRKQWWQRWSKSLFVRTLQLSFEKVGLSPNTGFSNNKMLIAKLSACACACACVCMCVCVWGGRVSPPLL